MKSDMTAHTRKSDMSAKVRGSLTLSLSFCLLLKSVSEGKTKGRQMPLQSILRNILRQDICGVQSPKHLFDANHTRGHKFLHVKVPKLDVLGLT